MDKLGKSLDQLITESSTQQTRRPQQQQQRQRHNQNQQNQKRDAIDKRRDLHRDNRPQSAGKIESSAPQRDFKVVTIERPRVVETSHARGGVPSTGSSVFNRLGSDEKTIVVFDNLRATVSERDVRDLCSSKGKITDVFLLNHPSGTKSARVSFENADDARKCVAEYNGLTLDGLPMRLSVASALPVATVFSRIQQPTGTSFQVSAAAPATVPALTAINNLSASNGNRGGLFGTALPKQQQQQQQQHHNAPHQGSRRVEVQSEQNNFKRERKEKVRNVKGRNSNQSQNKSRRVEENDEDLDEVLDNYFARK